jgi:general secretion pathway protein L
MEIANQNAVLRSYRWWLRELAQAMAPKRPGGSTWRTLLKGTPEGLEISTRSGKTVQVVGTLNPDASPVQIDALKRLVAKSGAQKSGGVRLRLAPGEIIERTIQIPQAASDVIEPVLLNQLERIVPWSQDETRYGYRIAGKNERSPDQLDIQVVATTRSMVENALGRADSLGLKPDVVDFASDADGASAIEVMSLAPDPAKRLAQTLHTVFLVGLVVVVLVSGFGLYHMWVRQTQSDELEAQIAAATARVVKVRQLNDANKQLRDQRERLVRRKQEEPAVMVLIEALARALPDSAYLTELEIHGRDTRIAGKSDDPTALITMLESTPQFEDVHFSAATTRDEGATVGSFSIIGQAKAGTRLEEKP